NPEPAARPATVRSTGYETSGRDRTPCPGRRRDQKLSHQLTSTAAGLADGSGLNKTASLLCGAQYNPKRQRGS
ncbi:MAG TPA: hypothetical protein VGH74_08350, partial [Planctomycetaceae bacterium]